MSDWIQRQIELATTTDAVAWAAGLTALAVYLLPYLVTLSGVRLIRFRAVEDPRLAEPDGTDADYAEKAGGLAALGFAPAGLVVERGWLNMKDFRKTHRVGYYRSADGRTLAALYRIGRGGPVRVALDGMTADGCVVQTVMPGAGIPEQHSDFRRTEHPWQPVAELLAEHRRQADAAGGVGPITLTEYAAADERLSRRTLAGIPLGDLWLLPVVGWLAPFAAAVGLFALLTTLPTVRLASLGFVVAGVCYPLLAFWAFEWVMGLGQWCEAENFDGAAEGHTTVGGVGVQEFGVDGRYVLALVFKVEVADGLPAVLADAKAAHTDWLTKRPDGTCLLSVVAPRRVWSAVEAGVRGVFDDGPEVRVGLLDGSDAPAHEFVLGGAVEASA